MAEDTGLSETGVTEESVEASHESKRLNTLKDVLNKTIKSYTRNLKLVKPIPNVDTNILRHLQNEAISQLEQNIKSEIDQMCEEENIEHLLNTLDRIVEDSTANKSGDAKSWKPSGDVTADLRAHTVTLKQEKLKVLQKALADLEAQNKLLRNKAEKRENHLIQTKDEITQIVNSLAQITETTKEAADSLS